MTTLPPSFAMASLWLGLSLLTATRPFPSPPQAIHTPPPIDLGYWDDAFACRGQDTLVGRRGTSLYALPISDSPDLKKLCSNPRLADARFLQGIADGKRLWLFTNASGGAPYAIDAYTGQIADFIPLPAKHSAQNTSPSALPPAITESHLFSVISFPHLDVALIEVTGRGIEPGKEVGDGCYWMSLKSGAVRLLPGGQGFDYMTPDESVAVFSRPHGFDDSLSAIDMKTAAPVAAIPSALQPHVQSDGMGQSWSHDQTDLVTDCPQPDQRPDQTAQAIFTCKPSTNSFAYFWGFTIAGRPYPLTAQDNFLGPFRSGSIDDVPHSKYFGCAAARGGFVGFLTNTGTSDRTSSLSLSVAPLNTGFNVGHPGAIETIHPPDNGQIEAFTLLANGASIFLNFLPSDGDHRSCEAFFHRYGALGSQNLLDGVQKLPPLPAEIARQPWMMDQMTVRLIKSFGSDQTDPAALCIFHQTRQDLRQTLPAIPRASWQRSMIVTSSGNRFLTSLFPDGRPPQEAWLHISKSTATIINTWSKSESPEDPQLRLQKTQINLANGASQ